MLPEWNVKVKTVSSSMILYHIRMLPEWNVKTKDDIVQAEKESLECYQNGM